MVSSANRVPTRIKNRPVPHGTGRFAIFRNVEYYFPAVAAAVGLSGVASPTLKVNNVPPCGM